MARAKDVNRVNPKEVYNYLVNEKGVSREHALGMLANIQAESGFNSGAVGDNGTSGGLFQHHDSRFKALKEHSKGDWTDWKKQVDYALSEKATKNYLSKSFETPEQASEWFTINWEVPTDKYNKAKQRLKNIEMFGWETSQNLTNSATAQEPATNISEPLMEGDNTYLLQDPTLSEQEPLAIVTKDQIEEEISKLKHIEKQVAESPERQAIEDSKKEMSKTLSDMGAEANIVDYAPQEDEPPVHQIQDNLWAGYEIPQLQTQLPTLPNIFETPEDQTPSLMQQN